MKHPQTLLASAVSLVLAPAVMAGEIQQIDLSNFGPLATGTTFRTLYDRDVTGGTAGATSYGEIGWDVLKAVDPGIVVYNNVPIYGGGHIIADCVMAPRLPSLAGTPDKQCNDGFQSHKRYKMSATAIGPIDLVFRVANVDAADATVDQDPARNVYRMIGKLNNHTAGRLGGFRVELGHGIGAGFTRSTAGDGLRIALHEEGASAADDLADNDLAEFPGGLFYGPSDGKHDWGFFSSSRAYYTVNTAALGTDEDGFSSTALSANYTDLFGEWLPIDWVPTGWFYDHDGNPATDAEVVAWNDGTQWLTYTVDVATGDRTTTVVDASTTAAWAATAATVYDEDGTWSQGDSLTTGTLYATWNATAELYELSSGGTLTNDEMTAVIAGSTTLERRPGYLQGPIEDLANLNLNYYVEIQDPTSWPGYNAADQTATFTLRITPIEAASDDRPAWVPAPVVSNGGGGCVLGSRTGVPIDPLLPGVILLALGYLGLRSRPIGR